MKNRSVILVLVLVATACDVSAQQAGTTTDCDEKVGGGVTCKTTQTPPTLAERLFPKHTDSKPQTVVAAPPSGLSPEAVHAILAEEKARRDAKDTVDYIYCRQNPKGNVADGDGKQKTCTDVIEYTKAFCSVNPAVDRCTLARSRAEVEKAFTALLNQYNSDPRRNKPWEQSYYGESFAKLTRWGCMSFPDMVLPQREGTHPCPNAPEPAPQTK
jgi:hypothetical protein